MGVRPRTLAALARQGATAPLPVQSAAIAPLLRGADLVMEAPTGSGKTLAFLVPLVERLRGHRPGGARALVVTPTRELATQVAGVLATLDPQLRRVLVFGGVGYGAQISGLRNHPDVVVGCPGRIVDLAGRGEARFDRVEYLVLDEADEMLDQGFARDVERIIAMTPARSAAGGRQTVLASATMPDWVRTMIDRHLADPERVRVAAEHTSRLEHGLLPVHPAEKLPTLHRLLDGHDGSAIVFHRTKHGAKKLARDLGRLGHATAELQGNLSQNARDRAIGDFRKRAVDVLVATNVAARGIDVSHVGLVVNFELPETPEWLTHRIGRTARNGADGRALTFITADDAEKWRRLRRDGAPDLDHVDGEHLLATGDLRYLPRTAAARPVVRTGGPARTHTPPARRPGGAPAWRRDPGGRTRRPAARGGGRRGPAPARSENPAA